MKTSNRMLLSSAAILLGTLASHCFAQSDTVTVSLTGTIQTGKSILVSSTTPIDHSQIYSYSISGTCHGTGNFALLVPPGTSLEQTIALTGSNLLPYLNGTVLDPSAKFPFTLANKLAKGTFVFGPDTLVGSARIKAGINNKGLCYGEFTNILFGVKTKVGTLPDKSDAIVIDNGQVVVQTAATSGTQPDLAFVSPIGQLVGLGVTGTDNLGSQTVTVDLKKKHSASVVVVLQNAGVGADTYTLSATSAAAGFTQEFIYKGKNITAAVTGTGFTLPPDKHGVTETLASGEAVSLTWKITDKSAATDDSTAPVLTVTSAADPASQDAIEFSATGL